MSPVVLTKNPPRSPARKEGIHMLVSPTDETVKSLLKGELYFRIPRFQREYSWNRENIEDFWRDAVTTADTDYFIGSFVVFGDSTRDDLLYLVDGQQRLTTVTIALAALRDVFDEIGEDDLARGIQGLIEKEDVNAKSDFVLSPETSYPYFQDVIQSRSPPELEHTPLAEEEALKAAYAFFLAQVQAAVEAVKHDATVAEARKEEATREKLISIREAILRLRIILVKLTDEDDAYLVFETMNTRGKDLGVSDLVKNTIYRILKPKNAAFDAAKEKWTRVRRMVEETGKRGDFDAFIHYSWLSRRSYLPRAKLFKELKAEVRSDKQAKVYLADLEVDAKAYSAVRRPERREWKAEHLGIRGSLKALGQYGVKQPFPLLMALIRAFDDGDLTKRQTEAQLSALENFHAAFTGVTSKRTGGGTAAMYAAAARDLMVATSKNAREAALRNFGSKLRERMPSQEDFAAAAKELRLLESQQADKPLIRYLLMRIDLHLRPPHGPKPDYDEMSIEHIMPQSAVGVEATSDSIGEIGNLILVAKALNSEALADRSFSDKKTLFSENSVPLDSVLLNAEAWGPGTIAERRAELIRLLHSEILTIRG